MGQKPSSSGGNNNQLLPLSWILRRNQRTTHNPNPEQPIKFQYKTRRKNSSQDNQTNNNKSVNNNTTAIQTLNNLGKQNQSYKKIVKNTNVQDVQQQSNKQNQPFRTKSESNLSEQRAKDKHRHRRKSGRIRKQDWGGVVVQKFGYEIQDVDAFLTKVICFKNDS